VAFLAVLATLLPTIAPRAGAAESAPFHETPIAAWRTNGVGYASLVVGNVVYVGGTFSTVRNPSGSATVSRANLAAFDIYTGALLTSFTANTNGIVRALATDGSRLYVGGLFTSVNGTTRRRVAAVNLTTGAVDPGWSADASSNVYALAVGGDALYVGGSFSTLKGSSRPRLGAVRLSDGGLLSFSPSPNATVLALAATTSGSRVYAGGDFTQVNGASRSYLVALNPSGSTISVNWNHLSYPVFSMSLSADGTRLAAGIAGYGNQTNLYSTSSGSRQWTQRCGGDAQAVRIVGTTVFSGFHDECDGNTRLRLTANDLSSGARDHDFSPTFDRYWGVRGIDGSSNALVIAGDFHWVNGVAAQGFAIFPGNSVTPPSTTTVPTTSGSLTGQAFAASAGSRRLSTPRSMNSPPLRYSASPVRPSRSVTVSPAACNGSTSE